MKCANFQQPHRLERGLIFALAFWVLASGSARQKASGQEADNRPPAAAVKKPAQDPPEASSKKDATKEPRKAPIKESLKAAAKESSVKRPEQPPKAEPREPIERRPYRISLHLACDPSARIDPDAARRFCSGEWQVLVRRFIGPPWVVTIGPISSPLANARPRGARARRSSRGSPRSTRSGSCASRSDSSSGLEAFRSRVRHGHAAARARSSGDTVDSHQRCTSRPAPVHSGTVQSDRRDHGAGRRSRPSDRPGGDRSRRRAPSARSSPRERSFNRCGWSRCAMAKSRS